MRRPHSSRDARYLRRNGRITDQYHLHAWWLRGIADEVSGCFRPPLHPDLYAEYDNGGWCVRNGYVRVTDPWALKQLIADTVRGLPFNRSRFAKDHPDLFALLERGTGENYRQ